MELQPLKEPPSLAGTEEGLRSLGHCYLDVWPFPSVLLLWSPVFGTPRFFLLDLELEFIWPSPHTRQGPPLQRISLILHVHAR